MNKEKLRYQYCLEKGGINPSNIIEWYYIEWLEYKLTEALKQSDNSKLLESCRVIYTMWKNHEITIKAESKADYYAIDRLFNHLNQNNKG